MNLDELLAAEPDLAGQKCCLCRKQNAVDVDDEGRPLCSPCIEKLYRVHVTFTERTGLAFVPLVGGCA